MSDGTPERLVWFPAMGRERLRLRREAGKAMPQEKQPSDEELLGLTERRHLPIWRIVFENEKASHTEQEIRDYVDRIWNTMRECVTRGLQTEGILPGGLKVRRRAPALAKKLEKEVEKDPLHAMDWVNAFAMAVNEENAAGGRMVTAPTNGAAGVIPAVAQYYETFVERA